MNYMMSIIMLVVLLLFSCKESATESNNDNIKETFIEILKLSPQAESVLTSQDTITASLQIAIAGGIQSDFGFSVSIKFASKIEGQTFSTGENSSITLGTKTGNVILEYPISQIWSNTNLKRPISCYFYLHQMTSETASKVIARTAEIKYNE